MRRINEIIIHCTATSPDWRSDQRTSTKVREVKRWHVEDRKWSDIGYHYLIDRDGTVAKGRPVERAGAHVKGHNANSIGVSLFGGKGGTASDQFQDNFTEDQERALSALIADLREQFPTIDKVSGHNQYALKACPTFAVPDWTAGQKSSHRAALVSDGPQPRSSPTQSGTVRASAVTVASGAGSAVVAVSSLDSTAQYIVLAFAGVIVLAGIWIMRERLRKWAGGQR